LPASPPCLLIICWCACLCLGVFDVLVCLANDTAIVDCNRHATPTKNERDVVHQR
jgi:hypothetical protein